MRLHLTSCHEPTQPTTHTPEPAVALSAMTTPPQLRSPGTTTPALRVQLRPHPQAGRSPRRRPLARSAARQDRQLPPLTGFPTPATCGPQETTHRRDGQRRDAHPHCSTSRGQAGHPRQGAAYRLGRELDRSRRFGQASCRHAASALFGVRLRPYILAACGDATFVAVSDQRVHQAMPVVLVLDR